MTPQKKIVTQHATYRLIEGSEDYPGTDEVFGGPHYTRNGRGRWAKLGGGFTPALGFITEEEAENWDYPSTIHSTFRS